MALSVKHHLQAIYVTDAKPQVDSLVLMIATLTLLDNICFLISTSSYIIPFCQVILFSIVPPMVIQILILRE